MLASYCCVIEGMFGRCNESLEMDSCASRRLGSELWESYGVDSMRRLVSFTCFTPSDDWTCMVRLSVYVRLVMQALAYQTLVSR